MQEKLENKLSNYVTNEQELALKIISHQASSNHAVS